MNTYIQLNDKIVSIEEIAKMAGIKKVECCTLCKKVKSGTISAVTYIHDEDFPGIDIQFSFPKEHNSCPALLAHTEQPKDEDYVRTYIYDRACDDYIGYTTMDPRTDDELDKDVSLQPSVTISGNPNGIVLIHRENPYVSF